MNQKNKSIKDIKRENSDADKILRGIRTLFELDEEDYYEPIRTGKALNSNYIEYETNGYKDKKLSIKEYLDEIEPYLNYLIDDLKTKRDWKITLTMAINFFPLKILMKRLLQMQRVMT